MPKLSGDLYGILGGIIVVALLALLPIPLYWADVLLRIGIYISLAVSLNLINGITGQFSLGHAGFMAIGAYTAAILTMYVQQALSISFGGSFVGHAFLLVECVIAGCLAALAGYVVGLPSLRLKGDYLAIVTLGFGEIIRVFLTNINLQNDIGPNGPLGIKGIPKLAGFWWIYGFALLTIIVVRRLSTSTHGRAMLSVREDEIAAEAVGVDTTGYKVRAFVISSFLAGVAGALYAHRQGGVSPDKFKFDLSTDIVVMVVLGGLGSTSGAVLAAIILQILLEVLRPIKDYTFGVDIRLLLYSIALVVVMLFRPQGLLGKHEIWEFFGKKKPKTATAQQSKDA